MYGCMHQASCEMRIIRPVLTLCGEIQIYCQILILFLPLLLMLELADLYIPPMSTGLHAYYICTSDIFLVHFSCTLEVTLTTYQGCMRCFHIDIHMYTLFIA